MTRASSLLSALLLALALGCRSSPPPADGGPVEGGPAPAPAPAPASDVFSLRFKSFTGAEVDDVVQGLQKAPGFSDWNHRGQTGLFAVYEARYTGPGIAAAVRRALEDAGLANRAEVTLHGNDLNVIKTGR